jgi:hypothetical protein
VVGRGHLHSWVHQIELVSDTGLPKPICSYTCTWDYVLSSGDNRKVCNKNCGNAYEYLKLRQRSQDQNH